jgi:hypothetical protein
MKEAVLFMLSCTILMGVWKVFLLMSIRGMRPTEAIMLNNTSNYSEWSVI